jgi:hypothetical protein
MDAKLINILGLVIDFSGALVIAYPLIRAQPWGDFSTELAMYEQKQASKYAKIGSLILAIGFFFQIIASWLA